MFTLLIRRSESCELILFIGVLQEHGVVKSLNCISPEVKRNQFQTLRKSWLNFQKVTCAWTCSIRYKKSWQKQEWSLWIRRGKSRVAGAVERANCRSLGSRSTRTRPSYHWHIQTRGPARVRVLDGVKTSWYCQSVRRVPVGMPGLFAIGFIK